MQKYVHDLDAWDALPVEEQERVIGRTKLNDIELPDDVKPANSHVALNTIVDDDGEERQILRYNMPFGSVGVREFGTYFIGYARNPDVLEQMLTNMFVGNPPGNYDRVLDFSTAVTGNLFFVPTADFLDDPPAAVSAPTLRQTIRVTTSHSESGASGRRRCACRGFRGRTPVVRLCLTAVVDPGDGEQYDREDGERGEEAPGIRRTSDQQQYDERDEADGQADADELGVEAEAQALFIVVHRNSSPRGRYPNRGTTLPGS